ncbi:Pleckstrin y domain-containing family M member 3 [Chionoecetes opilio]|uniref:Pleckstrin y domain-containing family M member 3 n=1 Tax=Chionoecetes opilio TaxID=41210 RepID=A0A8J5D1Q9_CHIOP|nr:Pleckstrin y domain-containing family M member 3 [Chionoecetes opilio]
MGMQFSCVTCPYVFPIKRCVSYKIYPKLKALDDVLGGAAAWENVDSTDEPCPKCSHPRAYFMQPSGITNNSGQRFSPSTSHGPVLGHSDNTNVLCNVLEAILIHGLRDSFSEKMSVLLVADPDRMPVPNFWPVVLIISHRDLIEQVSELSFISSEVGRSRAWVRLALNHGQIFSYLSVLLQDRHTLKEYYKTTAFLRDPERADITLGVLQPLASLTFSLATNAAVLNTWTQTPLVIAGIWTPSIQGFVSDPVLAATDVASTVYDVETHGVGIPDASTPISDHMFDMIIGGTPETSFISDYMEKNKVDTAKQEDKSSNKKQPILRDKKSDSVQLNDECEQQRTSVTGEDCEDSSPRKQEDTLPDSQIDQLLECSVSSTDNSKVYMTEWSVDSSRSTIIETSPEYNRLFSDLEGLGGLPSVPGLVVPDLDLDLSPSASTPSEDVSNESSQSDVAEKLSYEVVPLKQPSAEEMRRLLPLLTRLTTEEGLDAQAYKCYQCKSSIGMIYGKPRVCCYDSKYYCYECHENESALIPARLVHNWDFTLYPVCSANFQWLSSVNHQPLIDLRTVNPKLYCHIEDLAELQMMRTQLLYVRAYLFTCRSDAGQKLRRLVWPREHLYEHVHLYSVFDLQLVASGQLVTKVRQAVTFGRDHVAQCEVCSARGFHCELCSDNEVLFPFQLGNTYTCGACHGVYHSVCARGWKECPRCLRRAARREEHQGRDTTKKL